MGDKQRFFAELQFNYNGKVYDGDPTDLDQLAALENYGLDVALESFLKDFFDDIENLNVTISAVRPTRKTDK